MEEMKTMLLEDKRRQNLRIQEPITVHMKKGFRSYQES